MESRRHVTLEPPPRPVEERIKGGPAGDFTATHQVGSTSPSVVFQDTKVFRDSSEGAGGSLSLQHIE